MKKFSNVDAYISSATPEARDKLTQLRQCLKSILPQAEEKIWYGVPFYHQGGELVGFAAYAHHVSVGLGASAFPKEEREMLERLGYRTGQGTFQIGYDHEVPVHQLRRLLEVKLKSVRSGKR